ncbi:porin [Halothiobacillus sp. DCM-1]|uniref:porin n=1 Tax=Halothiobacillus sp. DCM-1 TaxID=3112558 RepID=UPI00325335AC
MKNLSQTSGQRRWLSLGIVGILCSACLPVQAANWIMLQGTEQPGIAPKAQFFGFIQPTYQKDFSEPFAGKYVPPKLIGPNLDGQSSFNILRARVGVRGAPFPFDNRVNYFLMADFGNNSITNGGRYGEYRPRLSDASVTLSYIPGARLRLGLFKYPGAEEGLQGIKTLNYINYTTVTNQLLLERYPSATDRNIPPQTTPNADMNGFSQPANGFRDTGVQVFDAFDVGAFEHTYAVMLGSGRGVQLGESNGRPDVYLYWSSAYLFDQKNKGPMSPSLKGFAWYQGGQRHDAYNATQSQDRIRYGAGITYLKRPFRLTTEYMWGNGLIYQGAQNPQNLFNNFKAHGGYVEGGWFIPNSRWELDLRYDTYTRNLNQPTQSTFNTWTAGVQYHFTPQTRVTVNYANRDFSALSVANNNQLKEVKGLLAVQVTAQF